MMLYNKIDEEASTFSSLGEQEDGLFLEEEEEEESLFRKMDSIVLPNDFHADDDDDDIFGEEDAFKSHRMEQLRIAHGSNLCVFSRDKYICNVTRKLRRQFQHLYVCSEYKDCYNLLAKVKNTNIDPQGVDVLIAELDPLAIKIAEYINNRSSHPDTNNCPLVPMIFLYHESEGGTELLNQLRAVGGASRIITMPFKTRQIFYVIIDVLSRRKIVEESYADLTKVSHGETKYPYAPLFEEEEDDGRAPLVKSATIGEFLMSDSTLSLPMNELTAQAENVDDWTECPSLLPDFLLPKNPSPDINNRIKDTHSRQSSVAPDDGSTLGQSSIAFNNEDGMSTARSNLSATVPVLALPAIEGTDAQALQAQAQAQATRLNINPIQLNPNQQPNTNRTRLSTRSSISVRSTVKYEDWLNPKNRPVFDPKNVFNRADTENNHLDLFPFFNKPAPEITAHFTHR